MILQYNKINWQKSQTLKYVTEYCWSVHCLEILPQTVHCYVLLIIQEREKMNQICMLEKFIRKSVQSRFFFPLKIDLWRDRQWNYFQLQFGHRSTCSPSFPLPVSSILWHGSVWGRFLSCFHFADFQVMPTFPTYSYFFGKLLNPSPSPWVILLFFCNILEMQLVAY